MKMRYNLRRALFWKIEFFEDWLCEQSWSKDWMFIGPWVNKVFCKILVHHVIPDQCGKPEHDFCMFCMTRFPGRVNNG